MCFAMLFFFLSVVWLYYVLFRLRWVLMCVLQIFPYALLNFKYFNLWSAVLKVYTNS